MDSLLIGPRLSDDVLSVNTALRESTVAYARDTLGKAFDYYSPWQSVVPYTRSVPDELLYYRPDATGDLLTDEAILATMATFMTGKGAVALESLPGQQSDWLPNADNISNVYDEAVGRIRNASATLRTLFDDVVDCVVPLGGGRNRGYSTHFARGAIFRSLPADNDACDVAFDVVHELGHQMLMVWQSVDPILDSDPNAQVFSQIRRRNRPAIQSYHATVALAFMAHLEAETKDDEYMQAAADRRGRSYDTSLSHSLGLAIDSIRKDCRPTAVGARLLDEMSAFAA